MTGIFANSTQLTAVLNKVNLSKVLLTLLKHEVLFNSRSLQNFIYTRNMIILKGKKSPISTCLVIRKSSLHSLDLTFARY